MKNRPGRSRISAASLAMIAWLIAIAFSLASCASPPTPTPTATPGGTTAQPTPSGGGSTPTTPGQTLIEFRRMGGVAGFDDRLRIDASRQAIITRKTGEPFTLTLDQDDFDRILQQFEQSDFTNLQSEYLPANRCCDLFEYTITYWGHTVRTMTTAVPERLQPVVDSLSAVVDRARR